MEPVVPPNPEAPSTISLTEAETEQLRKLGLQAQELAFTIGQLEIRKSHLLRQHEGVGMSVQSVAAAVAARCQLPPDATWKLNPDGSISFFDPQTGARL